MRITGATPLRNALRALRRGGDAHFVLEEDGEFGFVCHNGCGGSMYGCGTIGRRQKKCKSMSRRPRRNPRRKK